MKLANGMGTVYKLSGKRRKPYIVRKTVGWEFDEEKGTCKQKYITIGYAETRKKGLEMLMNFNQSPYDVNAVKLTFEEVFTRWSTDKYTTISKSNVNAYNASYKCCEALKPKIFRDLKLQDLQAVVDTCGKNYPTLRKLKVFFSQLYGYAMKYEICDKDYSQYVDIGKFKNRNPNKVDRTIFADAEINRLWEHKDNKYIQVVLMLIYSGVRVSELLNLKTENVHLAEHYFDVVASKTENGIRKVPIADKVYDFYKQWYSYECSHLLHTEDNKSFTYRNYYDTYWKSAMEIIGANHKPHDTRHTCISMLAEQEVSPTMIKKIVGHSGAMSLTERVYTRVNIQELLDAINKI